MEKMNSIFANVPKLEENKIFKAHQNYNLSKNENKMNLSIGQFLDDKSKPIELESVKKAEKEIYDEHLNKEYPPLTGLPEFNTAIQNLFFKSDSKVVTEGRIITSQMITGGASLRISAEIIKSFFPNNKVIYTSSETFGPYLKLYEGIEIRYYPYYNSGLKKLESEKLIDFLENLEPQSFILLQLSSHNPTGLDLSEEEWTKVIAAMKNKRHIAIFDVAYLGYGSGSIETDLIPIHKSAETGVEMLICYSSGKSFCNYSDCTGALIIVTNKKDPIAAIRSNIVVLCRSLYSFSSLYGSRIIARILSKSDYRALWDKERQSIMDRIHSVRETVLSEIKASYPEIDKKLLNMLEKQTGAYIFLDISDEKVEKLANDYGIYTSAKGRINATGISADKIKYLVKALKEVL